MLGHIAWRGPPGSGKRTAIHALLQEKAAARGVQLRIQTKIWNLEKPKEGDEEEDDDAGNSAIASKDQIPFETSMIHFGFDVSRMSLQDRHILKPIIERLGKGSHVLSGKEHTEARILIFYHIHLHKKGLHLQILRMNILCQLLHHHKIR
jgi:outer membrane protein OmpA-like peptidoglycan-associated protein